ncbi:MAG TPA: hypothetical protein VF769_17045 [Vitreimonas sp.]
MCGGGGCRDAFEAAESSEHEERDERRGEAEQDAERSARDQFRARPRRVSFYAAFEADREHEVERQRLGGLIRNGEVRSQRSGDGA